MESKYANIGSQTPSWSNLMECAPCPKSLVLDFRILNIMLSYFTEASYMVYHGFIR